MIEIEQIVDLISQNFDKKNEQDFIMDIFILGSVFKQNKIENYEFFQYFLNQILNVRQQVNLQIISTNRIKKLYNEYYNSNEDIIQLYQQLEMEIYDEPSKIKVKQMEKDEKKNNILQNFQQNQIDFNLKQKSIKKENDKVKDLLLESNQLGFKEHKNQAEEQQNGPNNFEKAHQSLDQQLRDRESPEKQYLQKHKEENIEIKCSICLDVIEYSQIIILKCSHQFHQMCINQHCLTQIQQRSFPINCPILECKQSIVYTDLKDILDDQDIQKYQQFTFKYYVETHNDEYSWCPTPDCQYVFIAGDIYFSCPVCLKTYCLSCKAEYHHNLTCAEYLKNQKRQELNSVYQQNQFTNNLNKLQQNQQQMISFQNPQFPNLQNQFQNLSTEKNQFIKSNNYPNFHLNSYTNQYIPPQQQLQFVNFQLLQPALQNPIEKQQQQIIQINYIEFILKNIICDMEQFCSSQALNLVEIHQQLKSLQELSFQNHGKSNTLGFWNVEFLKQKFELTVTIIVFSIINIKCLNRLNKYQIIIQNPNKQKQLNIDKRMKNLQSLIKEFTNIQSYEKEIRKKHSEPSHRIQNHPSTLTSINPPTTFSN
ncbi:unnamed protein product [Paramecium primaurelia]|uniref:RBR-type E3 ubiquitin transferase n=1 Tax=Paramecium primaurelia TaxID=5886 RepID=A0A8S1PV71_PARPR|nr:unnamed protein product [Paramecium primaurelia]